MTTPTVRDIKSGKTKECPACGGDGGNLETGTAFFGSCCEECEGHGRVLIGRAIAAESKGEEGGP